MNLILLSQPVHGKTLREVFGELKDNLGEDVAEWFKENVDKKIRRSFDKESVHEHFQNLDVMCNLDSECPNECCIKMFQSEHFNQLTIEE